MATFRASEEFVPAEENVLPGLKPAIAYYQGSNLPLIALA